MCINTKCFIKLVQIIMLKFHIQAIRQPTLHSQDQHLIKTPAYVIKQGLGEIVDGCLLLINF